MLLPDHVIGRDAEIAAIEAFLADPGREARAFVLIGEPGLGKTALWEVGLRAAAEQNLRTLVVRAAESEQQLAFTGLSDLVTPILDLVREDLPPPQRRALEIALLLRDPDDKPTDPRAIGSALQTCLTLLSASRPLAIAIDDMQWLDRSTFEALAFALRRTDQLPIGVLATVRTAPGLGSDGVHEFLPGLPPSSVELRSLSGLSLGALGQFLRDRLEVPVGRQALRRLHEASAGNPLLALEMGRQSLARTGGLSSVDQPILGSTVLGLVGDRIRTLPRLTQRTLVLLAAQAQPSVSAWPASASPKRALEPAVDAGLVTIDDDRIRFTHPLFAAAAYGRATDRTRRAAHRLLADRVQDPIEAARHTALAAREPSEPVATILERAAWMAVDRGAPGLAADLLAHAGTLTPPSGVTDRARRVVAEALLRWNIGEGAAARRLLETILPSIPLGRERSEAYLLLAVIVEWSEGRDRAAAIIREALTERPLAVDLEAALRLRFAKMGHRSITIARQAGLVAERLVRSGRHYPDLLACALLSRADACLHLGRWGGTSEIRAAELLLDECRGKAPSVPIFPATEIADELRVIIACSRDDLDGARLALLGFESEMEAVGWDRPRAINLAELSIVESWLGRLESAQAHANLSDALTLASGSAPYAVAEARLAAALVAGSRGDHSAGREHCMASLEAWPRERDPVQAARVLSVQGWIDLMDGRPGDAMRMLDEVAQLVGEADDREPAHLRYEGDRLEAAVTTGRLDTAAAIVEDLAERRRAADRPWLAVMVARGRALLAAQRGEIELALEEVASAQAAHEGLPMPLERGRTLLLEGRLRRRLRQKRGARQAFMAAAAIFATAGADGLTTVARTEQARVGIRSPSPLGLTETERRVARLAALGLTNRAVARELFLSPRSVDGVLTRIYQKLDIHTRAELGARLGALTEDADTAMGI